MRDTVGLEFTGTTAGVSAFDDALLTLLRFQPEVGQKIGNIVNTDPTCPMGYLTSAYLGLLSSERPDALAAADQLRNLDQTALKLNEREQLHLQAARSWASGDLRSAAQILGHVNITYPTDTLALYVGHQLDFFTGSSQNLNDRIANALPKWDNSHPHFGYLSAMWSFGLEESGNYPKAEEVGRQALELNSDDVWAIHAVVHVLEMMGRVDEGLEFLGERHDDWMIGNFLNVHNAWHNALFLLEQENYAGALKLYDSIIHNQDSANLAMEMVDASALLWRLHLDGVDVGDRWQKLANGWATKDSEPWYTFNDIHAVLAFVASDRMSNAEDLVSRLESYMAQPNPSVTNKDMLARAGLPIARAIVAHGKGNFDECVRLLEPIRNNVAIIGGSHAQRDVVHRTHIDSLQKSGNHERAEQLINARLRDRPTSVWSKRRLVVNTV